MADVEPTVWLPGAVQRPPIPEPRQGSAASKARQKDEFHLAEVGLCTSWIIIVCMGSDENTLIHVSSTHLSLHHFFSL